MACLSLQSNVITELLFPSITGTLSSPDIFLLLKLENFCCDGHSSLCLPAVQYEFQTYLADCLFGEVGFIFFVLINALWLTSPTETSKRLVHAEIALSLVAFLEFVTQIVKLSALYSVPVYRVFIQRCVHACLTTMI